MSTDGESPRRGMMGKGNCDRRWTQKRQGISPRSGGRPKKPVKPRNTRSTRIFIRKSGRQERCIFTAELRHGGGETGAGLGARVGTREPLHNNFTRKSRKRAGIMNRRSRRYEGEFLTTKLTEITEKGGGKFRMERSNGEFEI